MRRRKGSPAAAITVWLAGLLTPGAWAQQAQPTVYPPIEVWGVSGHSFGTIRLAQPTISGISRHSLLAEFVPSEGKTLAELAVKLWPGAEAKCLHFNWIQVVVDPGNPPTPLDAAGQPLFLPFLDPPIGGYQHDTKPADALPWFLDEMRYLPKVSADMNIYNPNITLPAALRWYAKPYSAAAPDAMRYDTVLVLVNDCTAQYEPLGGFHWKADFPQNGDTVFYIAPFSSQERFTYGALVTAFARSAGTKQKARGWTIRPLVKP